MFEWSRLAFGFKSLSHLKLFTQNACGLAEASGVLWVGFAQLLCLSIVYSIYKYVCTVCKTVNMIRDHTVTA